MTESRRPWPRLPRGPRRLRRRPRSCISSACVLQDVSATGGGPPMVGPPPAGRVVESVYSDDRVVIGLRDGPDASDPIRQAALQRA
eukprot:1745166-Pyramimonas_sp.AAC.1